MTCLSSSSSNQFSTTYIPLHTMPHLPYIPLRPLHSSPSLAKDVSRNNLQKTLAAHRSSNRAGLLRRRAPKSLSIPSKYAVPSVPSVDVPKPPRSVNRSKRKRGFVQKQSATTTIPTVQTKTRAEEQKLKIRFNTDEEDQPGQCPWLRLLRLRLHNISSLDNTADPTRFLDAEIRALEAYLSPTSQEHASVDQLVRCVTGILHDGAVPHRPQIIGSRSTGLAMVHSDVNFLIPVSSVSSPGKHAVRSRSLNTYAEILHNVKYALQQTPAFQDNVHISVQKQYPILTAYHRPTGLKLQFYCGPDIPPFAEYIKDYLAEYPTLRPLYFTTRLLLDAQGLFGPHTGCIHSEPLLMMIVAFLKINHGRFHHHSIPPTRHDTNVDIDNCLATQLLEFLHTYGLRFDYQSSGISIDPPRFFSADTIKSDLLHPHSQGSTPSHLRGQRALINTKKTAAARRNTPLARHLCIQDPSHYMHDLGLACTDTDALRIALAQAYERLRLRLRTAAGSFEGQSILSSGIRANFDDFETFREKLVNSRFD